MTMKKLAFCLAAALLLAGCGTPAVIPAAPPAPADPPAQQVLYAAAQAPLAPVLHAYAGDRGVALTLQEDAALVLMDHAPASAEGWQDLNDDDLVQAAATRAGEQASPTVLPLGRALYGYWAHGTVLTALLGEGADAALRTASWDEWLTFVQTLADWLAAPAETAVTLSGADFTLPAALPQGVALDGVFAPTLDAAPGYTAALLAAGDQPTEETLAGPLNGLYSALVLEYDHQTSGTALFTRGKLNDLLAQQGQEGCADLVLLPFKTELIEEDLATEEYNLTGLMDYPVLAPVGYAGIRAGADEAQTLAAKSALLWLYASGEGERALTETLGVITPWKTASDATALGAMQVQQSAEGILPGAELDAETVQALLAAEQTLQTGAARTKAERQAWRKAAAAALTGQA